MQQNRPLFALGLRLIAASLLATLLALVKYTAEQGIALPEILFWRQAVTLPMLLGYLYWTRQLTLLRTTRMPSHMRRAGLGMLIMGCNFLATILLPLAVSTTLNFTTPLFAVILSAIAFHERIGPWRWAAVALGFMGVVIVAEPGGGADISMLGASLGLFSALSVAVINFQIRDLARTEPSITIVFYFAAFGTPIAALFLPFFATAHDLQGWLLLLSVGVVGTICQVFLSASLRFAPVSSVIVMDYCALIWASLYGWLIWDHLPTFATIIGAPLIIGAGLIITWREHLMSRRPTTVTTLPPD